MGGHRRRVRLPAARGVGGVAERHCRAKDHRSQRRFPAEGRGCLRRLVWQHPPGPAAAAGGGLRPDGICPHRAAHRAAGRLPRMLPNSCFAGAAAVDRGQADYAGAYHDFRDVRRIGGGAVLEGSQSVRRSVGGGAPLWHRSPPPYAGDGTGTVATGGDPGHHQLHTAPRPDEPG